MTETIIPFDIGVFLHSLGVYKPGVYYEKDPKKGQDNLEEAIQVAEMNGFNLIQLGPVSDIYLGGADVEVHRSRLVDTLNRYNIKVGPTCVCFESGENKEEYSSIQAIKETGGLGYSRENKAEVLEHRLDLIRKHIDLTAYLRDQGVMASEKAVITTHVGFFDEDDKREYIKQKVVEIAEYCEEKDVYFAIESGSEKMENLIRFIKEVETVLEKRGNVTKRRVGVNFDTTNSALYGTEKPMDALNTLEKHKEYWFGVHAKEGEGKINPDGTAGGDWGKEKPIGKGPLNWGLVMQRLHEAGYEGPVIIEREGQRGDIDSRYGMAISSLRQKEMREAGELLRSADMYALQEISAPSKPPEPFRQ